MRELIPDMLSSFTVNIAYHANNPSVGMPLEKDAGRYKLFFSRCWIVCDACSIHYIPVYMVPFL